MLNPEYSKRGYRNAMEGREKHDRQQTCKHFVKTIGCEIDRESCRYCRHYEPVGAGEKQRSGYIGIRAIKPDDLMKTAQK